MGRDAALRTGLAESQGEQVFVHDGDRRTIQRLAHGNRPARPNYLGRLKQFAMGQ